MGAIPSICNRASACDHAHREFKAFAKYVDISACVCILDILHLHCIIGPFYSTVNGTCTVFRYWPMPPSSTKGLGVRGERLVVDAHLTDFGNTQCANDKGKEDLTRRGRYIR